VTRGVNVVDTINKLSGDIESRISSSMFLLLGGCVSWIANHPSDQWADDAVVLSAQSIGSILQRQLNNLRQHSVRLSLTLHHNVRREPR
jgi:hypothetical protein